MSADEKPLIDAVRRMHVAAGETIVLQTERRLMPEQCQWLKAAMLHVVPEGVKVIVLDGGIRVDVIGPAGAPLTQIRQVMADYERLARQEHGVQTPRNALRAIANILEGTT